MRPLVALVGRPNVGKSTLFNRLAGRRMAIVEDTPGVTRDRNYADVEWGDRTFTLIDTGGFVVQGADPLLEGMRAQAELAVGESDLVIMVVDGREGIVAPDRDVADVLRRSGKPVILVVNKVDDSRPAASSVAAEFWKLGFDPVLPISAEHGIGASDLVETVFAKLPEGAGREESGPAEEGTIRVAILGRPNVGKSTLLNALLGKQRVVASALPGTTRDAIDTPFESGGRRYILTDTAGIRRQKTVALKIEHYAVVAALRALERSDVAALVIDATEPAVDQDARIAQIAEERGRALLIVVNKWDQVEHPPNAEENFRTGLKERLKFVSYAPILFTSALKGSKVQKVLEVSAALYDELTLRAPTPKLNKLLGHIQDDNPAPFARGRPLRIYYIAQVATAPPTFALNCNLPQDVPDFYKRYVSNQIREAFRLRVPMRLLWRARPGQKKRAARKRPAARKRH